MNLLPEQFGPLAAKVEKGYDEAVKAISAAIKASPILIAALGGCSADSQSPTPTEVEQEVANSEMVYMALQAGEGMTKVSTPVVSSQVLRVVIEQKDDPNNIVVGLSGGDLGNSFKTYLPQPIPEGSVATLSAFVDSSCTDDSIESCSQKVVMVDVDKQDEACPEVRKSGDVCAVGNDEAPVEYAW